MRLKSRPVLLKTPVPCRFCKTMIYDGYKLTGPVTDYICDRCYQQVYKEIIEAGAFRMSDLWSRDFWSPLVIREDETALAGLNADMIRQAGRILSAVMLICLAVMLIITLPGAEPLPQMRHILSKVTALGPPLMILARQAGQLFGHFLQRLSEMHFL